MSADKKNDEEAVTEVLCCASCGISEIDDIKLKPCPHCDLVRYCSVECQENHREKHESICKERAAELHDEILFKQPENYLGDCPICMLPMPLEYVARGLQVCCGKVICLGCAVANFARQSEEQIELSCPFCRTRLPETNEKGDMMLLKRVQSNEPVALNVLGEKFYQEGDYSSAFQCYTRAVNVGDAEAHWNLSCMFRDGEGFTKDEERQIYHAEEAAIAGTPFARRVLAAKEWECGRFDRAVRHWIIAANVGDDTSLQCLKESYKDGHVSKEDFAAALRAHQAAVNEMKSPQRKAAESWMFD